MIDVNVIGEVNNPGPLVDGEYAFGASGACRWGLKRWRANGGNVELLRINRNGGAMLKRFRWRWAVVLPVRPIPLCVRAARAGWPQFAGKEAVTPLGVVSP